MRTSICFSFLVAFLSSNLFSVPFSLAPGDMSLGGTASIVTSIQLDSHITLDLEVAPSVSRIFNRNWELGLRPDVAIKLLRNVPLANRVGWGLEFFSRRYFNTTETMKIYVGPNVGMRLFDFTKQTMKWTLGVEGGVLIGLGEKVALDVGIPLTIYFDKLSAFNRIEIPIGYYGLRAFF